MNKTGIDKSKTKVIELFEAIRWVLFIIQDTNDKM